MPTTSVTHVASKATSRDDTESNIDLLVLTSRRLDCRERDDITDALFDVGMTRDVVISTLVLPAEEWESGPYRVLLVLDEVNPGGWPHDLRRRPGADRQSPRPPRSSNAIRPVFQFVDLLLYPPLEVPSVFLLKIRDA